MSLELDLSERKWKIFRKGFFILDAVKNACGLYKYKGLGLNPSVHSGQGGTHYNPSTVGVETGWSGAHWPDSLTVLVNSCLLRDLVSKSNGESNRARHLGSIYDLHLYMHRQTCMCAHVHTRHTPYKPKKVRKKNIFWLLEKGQNININRCLEAVDTNPHGWLRGSKTTEKSYPCSGVSKRAWTGVAEVAQCQSTRLAHRSWVQHIKVKIKKGQTNRKSWD